MPVTVYPESARWSEHNGITPCPLQGRKLHVLMFWLLYNGNDLYSFVVYSQQTALEMVKRFRLLWLLVYLRNSLWSHMQYTNSDYPLFLNNTIRDSMTMRTAGNSK